MKSKMQILASEEPFRSILLFGPPGSGKGTLGKFLSLAGGHIHLSSGDIFRGLSPDSPGGKLHQAYSDKGRLVPDEITVEIWHNYVDGLIDTNQYAPRHQLLLLDGIPRTVKQAELLDPYLNVVQVIVLKVDDVDALIGRMKRRAAIEKRVDDNDPEVFRTRMQVYQQETLKLLSHYPSSLISTFNANQRPLEVLRDVLDKLCPLLIK
ncbi:MAG TPA: nucleoside monophosphate kinase [Rhabdochlamydiaceae bacterium]